MSQSKEWQEQFPAKEQLILCCPQAPLLRTTLQAEDYVSLGNEGKEELASSEVVSAGRMRLTLWRSGNRCIRKPSFHFPSKCSFWRKGFMTWVVLEVWASKHWVQQVLDTWWVGSDANDREPAPGSLVIAARRCLVSMALQKKRAWCNWHEGARVKTPKALS